MYILSSVPVPLWPKILMLEVMDEIKAHDAQDHVALRLLAVRSWAAHRLRTSSGVKDARTERI